MNETIGIPREVLEAPFPQDLVKTRPGAFGSSLGNLTQPDRLSFLIGGDEQNPSRAVLLACDAGHSSLALRGGLSVQVDCQLQALA